MRTGGTTFVLVPGACHGGWWYDPLVEELRAHGHRAVAVTLAGLGPDDDLTRTPVNLDTHVAQLAAQVAELGPEPVVLVAHSYGGVPVTAVADADPGRVRALVHLDTDILLDGESEWDVCSEENRRWFVDGSRRDGLGVDPLPFFDERAGPHPLATLLQTTSLTGAWRRVADKRYAAAMETPGGLQAPVSMERVHAEPGWRYEEWPVRHDVLAEGPGRVLEFLDDLLQRPPSSPDDQGHSNDDQGHTVLDGPVCP